MTPPVEARGLTKRYGTLTAVDALDLRVGAGEVYGFLGPNGAGRTTTLRMLPGLPVFLGALMLILGVLAVGSEYAWDIWKTVLTQDPSRPRVYAAKLITTSLAALTGVLAVFAAGAVAALTVAPAEDQPVHWPGAADLLGFAALGGVLLRRRDIL